MLLYNNFICFLKDISNFIVLTISVTIIYAQKDYSKIKIF